MQSTVTSRLRTVSEFLLHREVVADAFRRAVLEPRLPSRAYWHVAPRFHRRCRTLAPGYVDEPIDPFGLVAADPDRIERFSAREVPLCEHVRWPWFGAVADGDWDRRPVRIDRSYGDPARALQVADRVTATELHRSLAAHFADGVPWEETTFVDRVLRLARERADAERVGWHWHGGSTPADVRRRCRRLDRVYDDMCRRGCVSARRLNAERGRPHNFKRVMNDEIVVDVARDGELLFVEGRHRLSLAKIAGLDRVPVAIRLRHPAWLDRRADRPTEAGDGDGDPDPRSVHPDLRDALGIAACDVPW